MAIGNSNSIPFKNRKGFSLPCLTNALLFTKNVVGSVFTNAINGEDDAQIKSNSVLLTGISSTTFYEDTLLYLDRVVILNSVDGINWVESIDDTTLYSIDTVNRIFSIKKIGHYYSKIELQHLTNGEYSTFCSWNLASNSDEEDNVVDPSMWDGSQTPFGFFKTDLIFQTNLFFTQQI